MSSQSTPEAVPSFDADEVCAILRQWMTIYLAENPGEADAFYKVRTAIVKSNYLFRRLYMGEAHRTVPCPVHKGHWSGCSPEPCPEGCSSGYNVTGWLPTDEI